MLDEMKNYDAWLERPYQEASEAYDAFVDWAENYGYDLSDQDDMKLAENQYESWLQDEIEEAMIADYEAAMERRADEARERAYFGDDW